MSKSIDHFFRLNVSKIIIIQKIIEISNNKHERTENDSAKKGLYEKNTNFNDVIWNNNNTTWAVFALLPT